MKYNIHLDGETQGPFMGAEHMKARGLSPEYNGNIWRPTN
tara:strand:- start:267 stop:386 length:120 start_codon:yes stop_codon:yes gene_type:complete